MQREIASLDDEKSGKKPNANEERGITLNVRLARQFMSANGAATATS
jgi:hypothetical protein